MQFVVFKLGQELFALNTERVQEIIDMMESTLVPNSAEYILGLINLRGSIKSLVDLSYLIDFPSEKEKQSIIIIKLEEEEIGLAVDEVVEVVDIKDSEVQSISSHREERYIKGIINIDNKLVTIIEVDDLLY